MENNSYTIHEISEITGLSGHTLRYYEKIGLLKEVQRDANGYRRYSDSDLAWIHFLMRLRVTGMRISDMKLFSDLRSQGESTVTARRRLLEAHQSSVLDQVNELKRHLQRIEEKIDYYKSLEGKKAGGPDR